MPELKGSDAHLFSAEGTPGKGVVARIGVKSAKLGQITERLPFHAEQTQHPSPPPYPKMKFRVKNWAEYDAGLRRRGSLT